MQISHEMVSNAHVRQLTVSLLRFFSLFCFTVVLPWLLEVFKNYLKLHSNKGSCNLGESQISLVVQLPDCTSIDSISRANSSLNEATHAFN